MTLKIAILLILVLSPFMARNEATIHTSEGKIHAVYDTVGIYTAIIPEFDTDGRSLFHVIDTLYLASVIGGNMTLYLVRLGKRYFVVSSKGGLQEYRE